MKLDGKRVAITGGGRGLGAEACRIARARGASRIVVVDLSLDAAREVADEVGGVALAADVTDEEQVRAAIEQAGELDVWIHNAGMGAESTPFTGDELWQKMWDIHVMGAVYASRALLPSWLERRSGHFSMVASANALTANPISAAYTASKHAELAFAEWLAMTYGSQGLEFSCFCPKGMLTPMLLAADPTQNAYVAESIKTAVTPEAAAETMVDLVESGRFLATTYAPILDKYELRAKDPDAYIAWLQAEHARLVPGFGAPAAP